jgi:hypothetical protein
MKICRFAGLALLGLLTAVACGPLSAQRTSPVKGRTFDAEEGEWVRVSFGASDTEVIEGSLQGIEETDLLILSSEGREVSRIPTAQVREVRVHRGSRTHALEGFGIGLLSGALFGGFVGLADGDDEPGIIRFSAGEKATMGAVAFGLIGGVTGLVIGAVSKTDRWERVSLPVVNPSVQVAPDGRIGVGVSIPTRR